MVCSVVEGIEGILTREREPGDSSHLLVSLSLSLRENQRFVLAMKESSVFHSN
jgi:hypothetical protein